MTNATARLNVRSTIAILCVLGIVAGTALLLPRSADAAALLRTALSLVAGENPSLANCDPVVLETCTFGDARLITGPLVRVTVGNLDPSRFPAGPACNGEVAAGSIAAQGLQLVGDIAPDGSAVTTLDIRQPGTAAIGDSVRVRIRCEFTNAAGLRERHATEWAGKF